MNNKNVGLDDVCIQIPLLLSCVNWVTYLTYQYIHLLIYSMKIILITSQN